MTVIYVFSVVVMLAIMIKWILDGESISAIKIASLTGIAGLFLILIVASA